jgi:hypothetical protein
MSTSTAGTGRTVRLAAGILLAGSALAVAPLAPAFAQTATGTALPATTNPATTTATADALDAAVQVKGPDHTLEGALTTTYYTVTSTKATASYKLKIRVPITATLGYIGGTNPTNSWYCTKIDLASLDCAWKGAATTAPTRLNVNYAFAGTKKATISATLSTTEKDTNPANNTDVASWVVVLSPARGQLVGRIWNDKNGDGLMEQGENGMPGIQVHLIGALDGSGGDVHKWVRTDRDGYYAFRELGPSRKADAYRIYVGSADASWAWTKAGVGGTGYNKDVDSDLRLLGKTVLPEVLSKDVFPKRGKVAFSAGFVRGGHATTINGGLFQPRTGPDYTDPKGSLPVTGPGTNLLLGGGAALLAGGMGLTVFARRRRAV